MKAFLKFFYTQLITRPVFNLLIIFLAVFNGNLWLAIIVITLIFRLALIKFTSASNQMAHWMSELQPKLDEIQEKYKDDKNRLAEETMKLWKKEWKSPFKWCLRMLIQIPVIMWLYTVIRRLTQWTVDATWLYSFFYSFWSKFVSDTAELNTNIQNTFLGLDLFATKNIFLAILSAAFTFFQMKLSTLVQPKQKPQKMPNGQAMPDMSKMTGWMARFMAAMIWVTVYWLQAAMWLYIVTTTLFSICQYTRQYRSLLHAKWLEFRDKPTIVKG